MTAAEADMVPVSPRLTREQESSLVTRLHDRSIEHRAKVLKELDARFYPTASPRRLPRETIESSVNRQVDQEMAKRQTGRQELESRVHHEAPPVRIDDSELQGSVERLYTESIARKNNNMMESKKRYGFTPPTATVKSRSEIQEYVTHLAVPKKREFTVEEINKIYGLA